MNYNYVFKKFNLKTARHTCYFFSILIILRCCNLDFAFVFYGSIYDIVYNPTVPHRSASVKSSFILIRDNGSANIGS